MVGGKPMRRRSLSREVQAEENQSADAARAIASSFAELTREGLLDMLAQVLLALGNHAHGSLMICPICVPDGVAPSLMILPNAPP